MADEDRRFEGKRREQWPGGGIVRLTEPYVAPRSVRVAAGTTFTIPRDGMYDIVGEATGDTTLLVPSPGTGQRDIIVRNASDTVVYLVPKNCTIEGSASPIQLKSAGAWLRAQHLMDWIMLTLGVWRGESVASNIPPPEHPGDILFSLDGEVWVPAHPMTSTRGGWLVTDDGYTVVDSP